VRRHLSEHRDAVPASAAAGTERGSRVGLKKTVIRVPCPLLDESHFSGMFSAQEEMDVGITMGIPLGPAAFPVLPCVIARILAEDFCRLERIRPCLRVEEELGPAVLRERGILRDSLR